MNQSIDSLWRKFFNHGKMQEGLVSHIQKGTLNFLKFAQQADYLNTSNLQNISPEIKQALSTKEDLSELNNIIHKHRFEWEFYFPNGDRATSSIFNFKKTLEFSNRSEFKIKRNNRISEILRVIDYGKFFDAAVNIINARNENAHTTSMNNSAALALNISTSVITLFENSLFEHDEDNKTLLKNNALTLMKAVIDQQELISDDDEEEEVAVDKIESDEDITTNNEIVDLIDEKVEILSDQIDEKVTHLESVFTEMTNRSSEEIINEILERTWLEKTVSDNSAKGINRNQLNEEAVSDNINIDEADIDIQINTDTDNSDYSIQPDVVYLNEEQAKFELLSMQRQFKKRFRCENWENISQGPFRDQIFDNKINSKDTWLENEFINTRYTKHKDIMQEQMDSKLGADYFQVLNRINFSESN